MEEESPAVVIDEDPDVLLSANPRTTLRLKTRTEEVQDYIRCQSKLSFSPAVSIIHVLSQTNTVISKALINNQVIL